jgi:hypothetical protein
MLKSIGSFLVMLALSGFTVAADQIAALLATATESGKDIV